MNITIDNKDWRFAFDKKVTLEIVCALFLKQFKSRNGINYMSIKDLVSYLFHIDIASLVDTNKVVTGSSYYFSVDGRLKSGELFGLINTNKDLFNVYTNIFNKTIIKINSIDSIDSISTNNLCEYTEDLIFEVYYRNERRFNYIEFDRIFNSDIGLRRSLKGSLKYITLDFLIKELELDREGVIESLALHNLRLKVN